MRIVLAATLVVATAVAAQLAVSKSATAADASMAAPVTAAQPVVTTSPVASAPVSASASARMTVGMNLGGVSYYSAQHPFLDRAKTADVWSLNDATGWRPYAGRLTDSGYPGAAISGAQFGGSIAVDDPALSMPDRYVLTWKGTAKLARVISGKIVSNVQGRATFDATSGTVVPLWTDGTVTQRQLVREDQEALLARGEIFNPAFLSMASNWSLLRFMDWNATNGSLITRWSERTMPFAARWSIVPLEIQIALANQTKADAWINIPALADDDYVRRTLTYVRDNLAPGLRVHVEYSNEMWNWGFQQTQWAQQKANALWNSEPGAQTWTQNGVVNYSGGNVVWYGFRSAQIAAIGKSVFGSQRNRLVNVVGTQTAYRGLESYIWNGVARANLGTVSSLFDEYAITTYFGYQLGIWDGSPDKAKIMGWARGGAAGIDAAFQEILVGGALSANFAIATLPETYAYHRAQADKYGLKLVAYEGGFHATSYQLSEPDQTDHLALLKAMQTDPRMAIAMGKMAADFAAAGGSTLTYFNDVGGWSKWGTWGLVNSIYDTNPRFEALRGIGR